MKKQKLRDKKALWKEKEAKIKPTKDRSACLALELEMNELKWQAASDQGKV